MSEFGFREILYWREGNRTPACRVPLKGMVRASTVACQFCSAGCATPPSPRAVIWEDGNELSVLIPAEYGPASACPPSHVCYYSVRFPLCFGSCLSF